MTILDACRDRALFGSWFSADSWRAWCVFLAALFGLRIADEDLECYTRHTYRREPPTAPTKEGWVIVGRRGGKSRIGAVVAVYLGCFRDYSAVLAPGEVGTVAIIAADRRQARVIMRYIAGFLDAVPMLSRMVEARTAESVTLTNRIVIEVHTASWRTLRGYTLVAAICDEIAFWRTDDSANPDREILAGLRPSLATVPGALLLCISSPYAMRGALYEAHRKHFGEDGDPVLVWQADTRTMNPTISQHVIDDALGDDPSAARSEWFAEFRADLESYIGTEELRACVVPCREALPPRSEGRAVCFVDPSGGRQDSFTWAIGWRGRDGQAIVAQVGEVRPPFNPDDAVRTIAAELKAYGVAEVVGDKYAGEWPRERFAAHGISYRAAEKTRSELYLEALPILTGRRCELPDHPKLLAQFSALQRRTGASGRDAIDHVRGQHDDVSNAVAGLLVELAHEAALSVEADGVERMSAWGRREPNPFRDDWPSW